MNNEGKRIANEVIDFVNGLSLSEDDFVRTIVSSHRTLQQSAMRLFVKTICALADNDYDERNEAAVMLAKKIKEIAADNPLPFI